jgi:hypothetical protein
MPRYLTVLSILVCPSRLFLPFDARIGRQLSNNVAVSFELGVPIIRDYPVYDLKTQVRLNVTC